MSVAIAKALPTCIHSTLGRVGFALGWKLLRKFTNLLFRLGRDFHSPRGMWRELEAESNPAQGFPLRLSRRFGLGETILFPL